MPYLLLYTHFRYNLIWGGWLPHHRYMMQAKTGGLKLSSLFTGPPGTNTKAMALVDTGVKCTLIYSNPQKFPDPLSIIDGYGGQIVMIRKVL